MKHLEFREWNFLIGDHWLESDKEGIFGPLRPGDEFVEFASEVTFPEILVLTGVFSSKTEARNNGWGEKREATFKWVDRLKSCVVETPGLFIPNGFTDFRAGKGKLTRITIWKPTEWKDDNPLD